MKRRIFTFLLEAALVLLTASGVILALLSNEVIGFLWNAVPRNW